MKDKNILVVGGGEEGYHRALKFSSAGANVKVLSLEFCEDLERLGDRVELIKEDIYNLKLLDKLLSTADIVVVALPFKDLNDTIISLARKHDTLVNLTNDADKTEVVVPFETAIDGIRLAATSEGKSGLVVKEALKRIEECLKKDREIRDLLNLMYYLKKYMISREIPIEVRMELYHKIFNDQVFRRHVLEGELDKARERLKYIVESKIEELSR